MAEGYESPRFEGRERGAGREDADLVGEVEDDGSIAIRSISPRNLSRSLSA